MLVLHITPTSPICIAISDTARYLDPAIIGKDLYLMRVFHVLGGLISLSSTVGTKLHLLRLLHQAAARAAGRCKTVLLTSTLNAILAAYFATLLCLNHAVQAAGAKQTPVAALWIVIMSDGQLSPDGTRSLRTTRKTYVLIDVIEGRHRGISNPNRGFAENNAGTATGPEAWIPKSAYSFQGPRVREGSWLGSEVPYNHSEA
jgi:hypothetical protein